MREPLRGYQCQGRTAPVSSSWNHPPVDATTWADGHWVGFTVRKTGLTNEDNHRVMRILREQSALCIISTGDNTTASTSSHASMVKHYIGSQGEPDC